MPRHKSLIQQLAKQPSGRLVALTTASYVTIIGAICGHDPETILRRALIASLGTGLFTAAFIAIAATGLSRR